jgi:hypothetical protein
VDQEMPRGSAFAAFVTGFKHARMPLIILSVRRAEPAATLVTEDFGGFVAGLIQAGNTFARRLRL